MSKDVVSGDQNWAYSDKVKDHFFNPRNFLNEDPPAGQFDAQGQVGSLACGDIMSIWLKIDPDQDRIVDLKWRTFGCASAIAATSVFSEMVLKNGGLTIEEAIKISPSDIMAELGGLPARKVHCSVLADKAFRQTLNNYFRIRGQHNRIITDGSRVIDLDLKITEQEVVEVIHQGAQTLEEIQARLKVGVGRPEVKAEIEKLIEKHRGQESKPFCPRQKP